MEVVIVVILSFILGIATEKARVEARKELKKMRAVADKPVAKVEVLKSAPPVKKAQKAPVKKTTKKAVAKKPVAKKTTPSKKK
jgi:hypothetical protein